MEYPREDNRGKQECPCLLMPEDINTEVVDDIDEIAVALRAGRLIAYDEPEPRLREVERVVRRGDVAAVGASRRVGSDANGQAANLRHERE